MGSRLKKKTAWKLLKTWFSSRPSQSSASYEVQPHVEKKCKYWFRWKSQYKKKLWGKYLGMTPIILANHKSHLIMSLLQCCNITSDQNQTLMAHNVSLWSVYKSLLCILRYCIFNLKLVWGEYYNEENVNNKRTEAVSPLIRYMALAIYWLTLTLASVGEP